MTMRMGKPEIFTIFVFIGSLLLIVLKENPFVITLLGCVAFIVALVKLIDEVR